MQFCDIRDYIRCIFPEAFCNSGGNQTAARRRYAKVTYRSISNLDMQLEFLLYELKTSFPGVWITLISADSTSTASDAVMLQFERPTHTSESARARRAAFGQKYFDMFAQNVPETPPMPDPENPPIPEQPFICECDCCDPASESASQRTYTVVSVIPLLRVARKYGATVQTILESNKGTYPDMTADFIKMGWVLKV